jgi:hypothetical protein
MDLRSAHRRLEEKTKRRFSRISRIFGMSVYHLINVLFSLLHATVALTSYVCWRVVARVSPFITQRMKKRRAQNRGGHLISENGDLRPEYRIGGGSDRCCGEALCVNKPRASH